MFYFAVLTISLSSIAYCAFQPSRLLTLFSGVLLALLASQARGSDALGGIILCFSVVLVVGQVLVPLTLDFVKTFVSVPFSTLKQILLKTLSLSIPAIVAGALSIYGSLKIDEWIVDKTLYNIPSDARWSCLEDKQSKLVCRTIGKGADYDTELTIVRVFDVIEADILEKVTQAVTSGDTASENGVQEVHRSLFGENGAIKPTLADFNPSFSYRKPCKWYHWIVDTSGCIKRLFLEPLDSAYRDFRAEFESRFKVVSEEGLESGDKTGAYIVAATERYVSQRLDQQEKTLKAANSNIFWFLEFVSVMSVLITSLACAKVVLIIFARLLYDPKYGDLPITFRNREINSAQNIEVEDITREITEEGTSEYGFIQNIRNNAWYANFSEGLSANRVGSLSFPRKTTFLFPRATSGKLLFQKFEKSDGSFGGHGPHDRKYLLVTIPEKTRLVVKLKNLMAFSDDVKMRSLFDVKIALLLRHSFFLRTFEGKGQLILTTQDGHAAKMSSSGSAAAPHDIVAFDLDGGLKLDVRQGYWDVYFGGYSLLPDVKTFAVKTSTQGKKDAAKNLFQKLLFFILPI